MNENSVSRLSTISKQSRKPQYSSVEITFSVVEERVAVRVEGGGEGVEEMEKVGECVEV